MVASKNLFFSVGEPSGDLHAAKLIAELRRADPTLACRGFGGVNMQQTGCHLDYELTNLAVVGFVEVVPKLREFFRVADLASDIFARHRPDAVILVDFPGFNWHIAKRAHQAGIPVIYYLPPQLWAWAGWRLKKMRKYVDHVLCNLPFEPQWYAERGVGSPRDGLTVEYVGHPFFDDVSERELDARFLLDRRAHTGLQVGVLPGSRTREVKHIWPMQLKIIRQLSRQHPGTRFLVACLRDQHCLWCHQQLQDSDGDLDVQFFVGKTSEVIEVADCCLMKSGSVSLEMMARGTPAVVVYHASRALYAIGRCLTNIQSMTLPNMIAGKTIMPEFLAVGSTGKTIREATAAMHQLLCDAVVRQRQQAQLEQLAARFARPGASRQAAESILRTINHREKHIAA